jgi:Rieske Fe-S protein
MTNDPKYNRRQILSTSFKTTLGVLFSSAVATGFSKCDSTTSGTAPTTQGTVLPNSADNNYFFSFAQYPTLQTGDNAVEIGVMATSGQKLVSVVRVDAQTVACVQMICTLAYCILEPLNVGFLGFSCTCHGCKYNPNGTVAIGPATQPLVSYSAFLGDTGITVNIA